MFTTRLNQNFPIEPNHFPKTFNILPLKSQGERNLFFLHRRKFPAKFDNHQPLLPAAAADAPPAPAPPTKPERKQKDTP